MLDRCGVMVAGVGRWDAGDAVTWGGAEDAGAEQGEQVVDVEEVRSVPGDGVVGAALGCGGPDGGGAELELAGGACGDDVVVVGVDLFHVVSGLAEPEDFVVDGGVFAGGDAG